jgi:hypothetical protein
MANKYMENVQHSYSSEKCKSKLPWASMSPESEWLSSWKQNPVKSGEDVVEQRMNYTLLVRT